MIRYLLYILLFLIPFSGRSQKIERYYDYAWRPTEDPGRARYFALIERKDSVWMRQDFYLRERKLQMSGTYRDQECKIPHGQFHYFHPNGTLDAKGVYAEGKKEGIWVNYHENGMMQDSAFFRNDKVIGNYLAWHPNGFIADSSLYRPDGSGIQITWFDHGGPSSAGYFAAGRKPQGKWQFFHQNGQLASIETYQQGQLLAKQYFDEEGGQIADTTNRDRDASFPGGVQAWKKYLEKKIFFPPDFKITGTDEIIVVVDFAVHENGKIGEVRVTAPFHPAFDRIAADAIRNSPPWLPAISHNRKVKYYVRQPVTFSQ